ncbi:MAG: YjgP/YjgQ family permease [Acidobacteria bacterium]|nr:YjgP/YjgQ family permease [Acidobacteriota bacterium]
MRILSRTIFKEVAGSALLGTLLFSFVLFLRELSRLFEQLVRGSAPSKTVAYLSGLVLPPVLVFSVPIGMLAGVLIALSRMSSDGEITAMRATGQPARRVVGPVVALALLGTLAGYASSVWLTPWSIRETYRIINQLIAAQLTAEIQPRVFEEQFPNTILYVGDVITGTQVHWKRIFIADLTPADQRKSGAREPGDGPRITVAEDALALPDAATNRIQLSMVNGSTHEIGRNPEEDYNSEFPKGDQILAAQKRDEKRAKAYSELDTIPLYREARTNVDAAIELHRRLALPPACLLLALIGAPLGVSSRKSGKSAAYVLTVAIAFMYWIGLVSMIGLAQQRKLPVALAVWTPNLIIAMVAVVLMARMETPGDRDLVGWLRSRFTRLGQALGGVIERGPGRLGSAPRRFFLGPHVIDTYVLSSFVFYFLLLLISFVLIFHVFTFFELLGDLIRNRISMTRFLTYLVFLTPKLIYDFMPFSVLVGVLVTFGVMAKNNEVTALKACGVSLYRVALPVLVASLAVSGALFAFDHYYVPEANRIQDSIRNEIKGRPPQTYQNPTRKWIFGNGPRIYYYKHFDATENLMVGVNVYDLDPRSYHLQRLITAERARWEPSLGRWVFQDGRMRRFNGVKVTAFEDFTGGTQTYGELSEPPDYFLQKVKLDKQMNFEELRSHIQDLEQRGFDTIRLKVQYHKKFAVPLFAFIMALLSVPFSFLTGSRGAMAGVGVSFGVAIAYISVSSLFEQVGNINQLPPAMAAWAPDGIFGLAGVYFLARMRT